MYTHRVIPECAGHDELLRLIWSTVIAPGRISVGAMSLQTFQKSFCLGDP
jgi:hypothetical protein